MHPIALTFWAMCAGIGYLIGDVNGAVLGGGIAMAISIAGTIVK